MGMDEKIFLDVRILKRKNNKFELKKNKYRLKIYFVKKKIRKKKKFYI